MMETEFTTRQLEFLEFDGVTGQRLGEIRRLLEGKIEGLLDRFYAHVLKQPELRARFTDAEAIERAREAQKRHWLEVLLAGRYGKEQAERAARAGKMHAQIHLTPDWYTRAYCYMVNQFVGVIAAAHPRDSATVSLLLQALNKAVFLDMEVVIDSYLEEKNRAMLEILRRATEFTDETKEIDVGLRTAVESLRSKLQTVVAHTESSKAETGRFRYELKVAAQLSSAAAGASAHGSDIPALLQQAATRIQSLEAQAVETASKANGLMHDVNAVLLELGKLDERLNQLQFGDKLYYRREAPR